jgi:hypothetical protein
MSENLKTILSAIAMERSSECAAKRSKSHEYANHFADALQKRSGINILEEGNASTNNFCAEVGGAQVAISPLASHEGWREKPSVGVVRMYKRRGCKWGIVLLELRKAVSMAFGYKGLILSRFSGTTPRFILTTLREQSGEA